MLFYSNRKIMIYIVLALGPISLFQNCSQPNEFSSVDLTDASLALVSTNDTGVIHDIGTLPPVVIDDGGAQIPEGPQTNLPRAPAGPQTNLPPSPGDDGGKAGGFETLPPVAIDEGGAIFPEGPKTNVPRAPTPTGPVVLDDVDTTLDPNVGAVECRVGTSEKIILAQNLQSSTTNASGVRVCMSTQACLGLVNDYISTVSPCNLQSSGAGSSCTSIFPGSRGTCKHVRILSDTEVSALLSKLSNAR